MKNFELFLKQKKNEHFLDDLCVAGVQSLKAFLELNHDVPTDYIHFTKDYGVGEIKAVGFMLYEGFLDPCDIFDAETAELFKNIVFFGDDMQGHTVGFDRCNGWVVVEVDSSDMSLRKVCDNFSSFLYRLLS